MRKNTARNKPSLLPSRVQIASISHGSFRETARQNLPASLPEDLTAIILQDDKDVCTVYLAHWHHVAHLMGKLSINIRTRNLSNEKYIRFSDSASREAFIKAVMNSCLPLSRGQVEAYCFTPSSGYIDPLDFSMFDEQEHSQEEKSYMIVPDFDINLNSRSTLSSFFEESIKAIEQEKVRKQMKRDFQPLSIDPPLPWWSRARFAKIRYDRAYRKFKEAENDFIQELRDEGQEPSQYLHKS